MNIKELRVGKGKTIQVGETWTKLYHEIVVTTEGLPTERVNAIYDEAEAYLDQRLNLPAFATATEVQKLELGPPPELPPDVTHPTAFDPEELMQHPWKGKKTSTGYAKGSLEWGWDFADQFSPEALEALPQTIGGYQFTLSDNQKIVSVAKTP